MVDFFHCHVSFFGGRVAPEILRVEKLLSFSGPRPMFNGKLLVLGRVSLYFGKLCISGVLQLKRFHAVMSAPQNGGFDGSC